uniref:Uncharacterized protein n=1 Tax=Arundo donax TaxID=35708 RepID=A0A0A9CW06_ARUDO
MALESEMKFYISSDKYFASITVICWHHKRKKATDHFLQVQTFG